MTSKWLPYREIAKRVGMTQDHVRHRIKEFNLQPYKEHGRYNCKLYNFDEFLAISPKARKTQKAKDQEVAESPKTVREIQNRLLTLTEKITKLRALGVKAGKIAKLCNTTIPDVWEVIQKDTK